MTASYLEAEQLSLNQWQMNIFLDNLNGRLFMPQDILRGCVAESRHTNSSNSPMVQENVQPLISLERKHLADTETLQTMKL